MSEKVSKSVRYVVHYRYPTCSDYYDGPFHDEYWGNASTPLTAQTDKQARLQWLGGTESPQEWRRKGGLIRPWHQKESCRHGRTSFTLRIEKIVYEVMTDGFERTTTSELSLPRPRTCACGKVYWPIKGESACHKLVTANRDST